MALDKAVDSAVLDAGLESIADAIRGKTGGSGALAFPNGFVSAISSIAVGGGLPANLTYIGEYTSDESDGSYGGFSIPVTGYGAVDKWLLLIPKQMGSASSRICRGMIVRWASGSNYSIMYIYAGQSGGTTMTTANNQAADNDSIHIIGSNMYRLKRGSGEGMDNITFRCYGIG